MNLTPRIETIDEKKLIGKRMTMSYADYFIFGEHYIVSKSILSWLIGIPKHLLKHLFSHPYSIIIYPMIWKDMRNMTLRHLS